LTNGSENSIKATPTEKERRISSFMQWLSGDVTGKALQAMADTLIGDTQVFLRMTHCVDIRDTIIIRKIRQMERYLMLDRELQQPLKRLPNL
jgi:hypothetical protein